MIVRQSTAVAVMVGPVLDADGAAVTDGVVADFLISKNGGAPAALDGSATLTHRHTGHYSLSLTANDLDTVGLAQVTLSDTVNACPEKDLQVIEEAVYDRDFAAASTGIIGTAQTGDSYAIVNSGTHGNAALKALIDTVDTVVDAILVDTGTDIPATLATIAGYVDTEVASILAAVVTELADLITTVGVAGAGLTEAGGTGDQFTAVPWNASWDAEVQSEVADALAVYDPPTNAEMEARTLVAASYATSTVCTEGRLSELDAANLPADVDQLKGDNPNRPTRTVQFDLPPFMMVDETDGYTPETGVTVTATISKDGGAFAACTNAVSEISGGYYKITLTGTEMTATTIALKFTGTGCRQTNISFTTQPT